jgi:FkbM family methyltransferase
MFDQTLANLVSAARSSLLPSRLIDAVLLKIREMRLTFGDPLVDFEWCGTTIQLPLSHDLPRFANRFLQYNMNLGRLAQTLAVQLDRPVTAVDVGANVGDTACVLVSHSVESVLCVEGSPRYANLLRMNTAGMAGVVCCECLVDFAGAPTNLCVSETRGTGFVVQSAGGSTPRVLSLEQILRESGWDSHTIDLLKIDTDGYDGAILRRHRDFLAQRKPVLFFEFLFSGGDGLSSAINLPDREALQTLAGVNYDRIIAFRNTGEPAWSGSLSEFVSNLDTMFAANLFGPYADLAAFPKSTTRLFDGCLDTFSLK